MADPVTVGSFSDPQHVGTFRRLHAHARSPQPHRRVGVAARARSRASLAWSSR